MNGSITPEGRTDKSGVDQHRSKSPEVMILDSTKILNMVRRPSSISAADGILAGAFGPLAGVAGALGVSVISGAGGSIGKLLALLSISLRVAWTSGSSGNRCRIVSYSRIAEESCPICT